MVVDHTWITVNRDTMVEVDTSETNLTLIEFSACSDRLFHGTMLVMYVVVCAFGLIGNTLSFAVIQRSLKYNSSNYLLKVLALTDNAFLVFIIIVQIHPMFVYFISKDDYFWSPRSYTKRIASPMSHTIHLGSILMVVLVTVNRFIAVCKPLHAASLCSIRNVRYQIVGLFVFAVLFNIPRYFNYIPSYVNVTSAENGNSFHQEEVNIGLASSRVYNIVYVVLAQILVYVASFGVISWLNVYLVRELRRAQRLRSDMVDGVTAQENNITKVVIILILTFIVCEAPAGINILVNVYLKISGVVEIGKLGNCSAYARSYHVCYFLAAVNSSANFAIYCLFRRQFRSDLRSLFKSIKCGSFDIVDFGNADKTTSSSQNSSNLNISGPIQAGGNNGDEGILLTGF